MTYGKPAQLFNSAIESFALVSAWDIGLLDAVQDVEVIDIEAFARDRELQPMSVKAIVDALASAEILEWRNSSVVAGVHFTEFMETKGFFKWLLGGCGELLRQAGPFASNSTHRAAMTCRDGAAIAEGCADFGKHFIDDTVLEAVLTVPWTRMVDLGCGSGDRLIRHVRQNPGSTGVGVDISASAVEFAQKQVQEAGLADRITVIQGDVLKLEASELFENVDVALSFLMGHDFWPRERCIDFLKNLTNVFPSLRHFFLCDTYQSGLVPSNDIPILTMGFEYVHGLLGQYIPTLDEWREVIAESGWNIGRESDLFLPPATKIFRLERNG